MNWDWDLNLGIRVGLPLKHNLKFGIYKWDLNLGGGFWVGCILYLNRKHDMKLTPEIWDLKLRQIFWDLSSRPIFWDLSLWPTFGDLIFGIWKCDRHFGDLSCFGIWKCGPTLWGLELFWDLKVWPTYTLGTWVVLGSESVTYIHLGDLSCFGIW